MPIAKLQSKFPLGNLVCTSSLQNQLAEAGLDSDQVNAVLGIIDDHAGETLNPNPQPDTKGA